MTRISASPRSASVCSGGSAPASSQSLSISVLKMIRTGSAASEGKARRRQGDGGKEQEDVE